MIERQNFIPDLVWVRNNEGWLVPLDRNEHPSEWADLCNSDQPIVTQVDDGFPERGDKGFLPTSSSSSPSVMAEMIEALDVSPGMSVLEIGTGTGYNAALLSEIVGAQNVTTIEVDSEVAEHARKVLHAGKYSVSVVNGDGMYGWPRNALYDRIIATASVQYIPYTWVEQTRTGGRIVAPVSYDFRDTGTQVALTVCPDGTATGRFGDGLAFMHLRAHRPAGWISQDGEYDTSVTPIYPAESFEDDYDARFVIALMLPGCKQGWTFRFEDEDGAPALCLQHPASGSWASFTRCDNNYHIVRQHGSLRLWDDLESVYKWWVDGGRPQHYRFGVTVSKKEQVIWLDSPERVVDLWC